MKYVTVPAVMMVCLDQVNCLAMALDHASDDARHTGQTGRDNDNKTNLKRDSRAFI